MAAIELFGLTLAFGIAIIFSIIGITNTVKDNYYKFIAAITWVISTFAYFIVFNAEGSVLVHLTWAWLGLALAFIAMGINDFFNVKKEKRNSMEL
jgi:signal transduction histidine kinase